MAVDATKAEAAVAEVEKTAASEAAAATGQAVVAEVNKKDAEASTTKVAAEAAVALANGAAAATMADAAEREREIARRVDTWQQEQTTRMAYLETEAKETRTALNSLASGISGVMEALSSLRPQAKTETTTETVVTPQPEQKNEKEAVPKAVEKTKSGRRML